MPTYRTPGVYKDDLFTEPAAEFRTGVPVFLGFVKKTDLNALRAGYSLAPLPNRGLWLVRFETPGVTLLRDKRTIGSPVGRGSFFLRMGLQPGEKAGEQVTAPVDEGPQTFTLWADFANTFDNLFLPGYLAYAVRGFFANDGQLCYVQTVCYDDQLGVNALEAIQAGLQSLEAFDEFDLVCAPDIMLPLGFKDEPDKVEVQQMQQAVLEHCRTQGDRFAILDALPGLNPSEALDQRAGLTTSNNAVANGALYYPWIQVAESPGLPKRHVPPCGHVAGVYARSDREIGIHKVPANEILEGVLDLEVNLTDEQQGPLNVEGINCLRAFPGRGIRIWGARTLSPNPFWRYVNVRRLFLTAGRWIERNMAGVVFEPHGPRLWARIVRDLTAYFNNLHRRGALKGARPEEAFYVKCDADLNPPEVQEAGMVITEVGLAPAIPAEFIVVRLVHDVTGLRIVGPT